MTTRRCLGSLTSLPSLPLAAALLLGAAPASATPSAAATQTLETASVASTSAGPRDPKQDFPRLPRECATRKELIPQRPVRCDLNEFDRSRPTLVLWGDSHVWQLIPGVRLAARGRNINLVAFMAGSCAVMDPNLTKRQRRHAPDCLKTNEKALDLIHRLKQGNRQFRVLIATNWQRNRYALKIGDRYTYHGQMAHIWEKAGPRAFRTLGRWGVGVDVVGQALTVPADARRCRKGTDPYACSLPRHRALPDERGNRRWVKRDMRELAGQPRYIDINTMCSPKLCRARPRGVYTFWDEFHISASMSKWLSPLFDETVTRAGGKQDDEGGGGCTTLLCL